MRSRMTISSGEEDSATSASANWWRTSHGGGGGGGGGGCAPPLSNSNWNEFQSWSPNITQSEDNLSNTFTNTSNDSQELAESCASLSLLQSTVQMEPNSTVSDSQMWSQVLLGVGNREVQGNMYEEGMTSEAPRAESLEVSGLVRKMEEEETPCWEFVNLAPFHGEDLIATNNNINMARQIAPLNYNNIDGSNYGISNLSSWSLAYPQNVQQPIHADFNHGSMNAFRSGLEFPMPNFELKQKSRLSHTVTPPLGTEGYKRKALPRILESKSNSLNSPDASSGVGARCYTGTLLAVEGRWQFNSLNKPLLDFPGKNQPQSSPHHQTMGNVQRREPNNNEIMKRRTTTETTSHETIFKRPRLEGASLPSKVPKAKLGDRITALQQLVSPFGKTDTASVLLEAIGYIKFLQEQVQVLSAPI